MQKFFFHELIFLFVNRYIFIAGKNFIVIINIQVFLLYVSFARLRLLVEAGNNIQILQSVLGFYLPEF